jgi:hypothetical protein
VLPEVNATNIVDPQTISGTLLGVPFAPGPTAHHVTYVVSQHKIDALKFAEDLAKKLKGTGINIRTLSATSGLRSDEKVVIDEKTISIKEVPGLGSQIDMYLWYDTGAEYPEYVPLTEEPVKTVTGSLQAKTYTDLPQLERPVRVAITARAGASEAFFLRYFLNITIPTRSRLSPSTV